MVCRRTHGTVWLRRVSIAAAVTAAWLGAAIAGSAPPAFAAALTGPEWLVSSTAPGATGVGYTYTFTTATTAALDSVTMTVPSGTGGTPAVGTVTPSSVAAGGSVSLAGGTLTYTFTLATVSSGTAVSIQITGLANTSTTGSYTSVITTNLTAVSVDSGTTPAVSFPGSLTLAASGSLTWAVADNGHDQNAVDTVSADQQLTVEDSTGTGAGWHVTVSASTFTSGAHNLPVTGTVSVTGDVSSPTGADPSVTCTGSCIPPANTATYPVSITTAASSPPDFTLYDASAGTGVGAITVGGSGAAHPLGWWILVPASAYVGSYTSTFTLTVVSGP